MDAASSERVLLLAKAAELLEACDRAPLIERIEQTLGYRMPDDREIYDAVAGFFHEHPECPDCQCVPKQGEPLGTESPDAGLSALRSLSPGVRQMLRGLAQAEQDRVLPPRGAEEAQRRSSHIDNANSKARRRLERTQDKEFRVPILEFLAMQSDGHAPSKKVRESIEAVMAHKFTPDDREWMPNAGSERWWNSARWERKHMMLENPPLLNPDSVHGIWEITQAGREYLRTQP